ncbi:MAG TPA: hypothetical protein VFD32_15260 [Dehalococcoidia bacterium]|nr:hypothetical protein [Dehalococcoidia bacterium]
MTFDGSRTDSTNQTTVAATDDRDQVMGCGGLSGGVIGNIAIMRQPAQPVLTPTLLPIGEETPQLKR